MPSVPVVMAFTCVSLEAVTAFIDELKTYAQLGRLDAKCVGAISRHLVLHVLTR